MPRLNIEAYREYMAQREEQAVHASEKTEQHKPAPLLYTVEDLRMLLNIGRSKAYELVNMKGFPVVTLGRRKLIHVGELNDWLKKNTVA